MQNSGLDRVGVDDLAAKRLRGRVIVGIEHLELLEDGDDLIVGVRGQVRLSRTALAARFRWGWSCAWTLITFAVAWFAARQTSIW